MNIHPEQKVAGVLVPVFALRREGDLGIGDTAALIEFIHWARRHALHLVQILPINETGADNSPYNAISSTALDPVLLRTDPEGLVDLDPAAFAEECARYDLISLRSGPVDYGRVKALKLALLWRAFEAFENDIPAQAPRARAFAAFRQSKAEWMEDYALFRVLMEEQRTEQWDLWPLDIRKVASARRWLEAQNGERRRHLARQMKFHIYVQWQAFLQWDEVRQLCDRLGVALMGDVPIGVSYYSADVFSRGEIFELDWSGGAPPERIFKSDPFTEKWGQNWGIPHYRWDVLRELDYDWWRQRVATVRSIFHLFRIDHILGFYRIYSFPWRPQRNDEFLPLSEEEARVRTGGRLPGFLPRGDDSLEDRLANRQGGEVLLRMVLEEVGEFRLVGEDLGVVPDYVRPSLASLGIAGFKIPMWETAPNGSLLPGSGYERLSLATYATHDHDPLRTMWEKWDAILAAAAAGDKEAGAKAEGVRAQMQQLLDFADTGWRAGEVAFDDALREALLTALFHSNSWIAVAMITDLFGTTERFNVPGAVADSNWTRRMDQTVADWERDTGLNQKMERLARIIRASGRAPRVVRPECAETAVLTVSPVT
ncbi:MAG: 4-alpha-glucanotransferase [Candidatus Methylacidiphilales bacterium]|nr:4-alpha-glucanotransferase [Candidatus Methylacidiphilales bacterium]